MFLLVNMRNDRLPFFSGHLEAFFAPLVQSFGKAFLVLDEKKKKRDKKEMDWAKISGREGLPLPLFPFPPSAFSLFMRQVLTLTQMNLEVVAFLSSAGRIPGNFYILWVLCSS